jgi:hypothetical protein
MPFLQGDVTVKQIDARKWELREPLVYEGRDHTYPVPVGFTTDFASVPTVFVWLIPRYGVYTKAAILHDFLCCGEAGVSRGDADGMFRRALRELGVSLVRRWMMWAAVRLQSRLTGATWRQGGLWLFVTLPSVVVLAVPALVVTVWLGLFWVVESLAYALTGARITGGTPNKPTLSGAPSAEGEKRAGGLPG